MTEHLKDRVHPRARIAARHHDADEIRAYEPRHSDEVQNRLVWYVDSYDKVTVPTFETSDVLEPLDVQIRRSRDTDGNEVVKVSMPVFVRKDTHAAEFEPMNFNSSAMSGSTGKATKVNWRRSKI